MLVCFSLRSNTKKSKKIEWSNFCLLVISHEKTACSSESTTQQTCRWQQWKRQKPPLTPPRQWSDLKSTAGSLTLYSRSSLHPFEKNAFISWMSVAWKDVEIELKNTMRLALQNMSTSRLPRGFLILLRLLTSSFERSRKSRETSRRILEVWRWPRKKSFATFWVAFLALVFAALFLEV